MGRIIDADFLIENLGKHDDFEKLYVAFIIGFIQGAPTIKTEQEWIPCSDRLPEKYGWYLCTAENYRVTCKWFDHKNKKWIDNIRKNMFELYDITSKLTGKRICEEDESIDWTECVDAWMPLPEPYKTEGVDDER